MAREGKAMAREAMARRGKAISPKIYKRGNISYPNSFNLQES
jgi:hypothetical protein